MTQPRDHDQPSPARTKSRRRDRVLQAVSTLLASVLDHGGDPIAVFVREAKNRQAWITTVTYRGRPAVHDA
ncbi:MAG: hypothetical protein ACM31C_09795 [Acidobacteriota bacterium]